MTPANKTATKILKEEIEKRGSQCEHPTCMEFEHLEFHHVVPTALHGSGRGKIARAYDIRNNLEKYILLCVYHHRLQHEDVYHNWIQNQNMKAIESFIEGS